MRCPAILQTESERLTALSNHGLDDESLIPNLDPVVHIAARMFGMPVAAVNMIGSDHVFFAAHVGAGKFDMSRDVSFCAHTINQPDVMVVPDASLDERFHDNPLVTGEINLRFYAGVPLFSPEGLALGALCIVDNQPHTDFSASDQLRLQELAKMASDRLELRRIEVSGNKSRPNFEEYAGNSTTPVVWFDQTLRITAWNNAAAQSHGYSLEEGIGKPVEQLMPERSRPIFHEIINKAITAGSLDDLVIPSEINGLRKDGTKFILGFSLFSWKDAGGIKFEAVLKDITAQRLEEIELHQQANIDPLTGLGNRGSFYRAVESAMITPSPMTVLMIDLDGFKDVNDTLGDAAGDTILKEVSNRLLKLVDTVGVAARIGGDEFAIMWPHMTDPGLATQLAEAAVATIAIPINVDGQEVRVAASCGIAIAPKQAQEALELVSNADLALFKAKSIGRGQVFLFVTALRLEAVVRRLYALELHRAVDDGEFLLFYQPQVDLITGEITGAEALLRWHHPERGILSPIAFLPALERGTLAATVGTWVLDEACAQAAYWRRNGSPNLRMGVNLFGAQFHVGNLVTEVIEALERHGLPPEALELEITETIAPDNDDVVLNCLHQLYNYGVGIALDDFGTGYASLSLLKTYPLTRIKIDQSFVHGMLEHEQDASVIRATLDIARSFRLETIAEGIETESQRYYLLEKECMEGQGYLFGKPIPAAQFSALIESNKRSKAFA
jgi:diguanylate cyclase (GGDEF)-like protein/PAS domain S-box-containing protein